MHTKWSGLKIRVDIYVHKAEKSTFAIPLELTVADIERKLYFLDLVYF